MDRVFAVYQFYAQFGKPIFLHGHTQETPTVGNQEVDGLRSYLLGSHYQVAFVFALLIVDDYENFASLEVFQGLFHAR